MGGLTEDSIKQYKAIYMSVVSTIDMYVYLHFVHLLQFSLYSFQPLISYMFSLYNMFID